MISLLYNQFLAGTNAQCNSYIWDGVYSPNITILLNIWIFGSLTGKFLSRASNTMPPRVRSPRPFCLCLDITYTKINPQMCWIHRYIQILDMSSQMGEKVCHTIAVDPRTHCRSNWSGPLKNENNNTSTKYERARRKETWHLTNIGVSVVLGRVILKMFLGRQ